MPHSPDPMRHIPEEELHAYLDQALSRSQCVEIEHHLAACMPCRAERDAIAALRDRTTSLLVAAAPRRIRPRPYAQLSAAYIERHARRGRLLRNTAWAASVAGALGLGWAFSQWSASSLGRAAQATDTATPATAPLIQAAIPAGNTGGPEAGTPVPVKTASAPLAPTRSATTPPPTATETPEQGGDPAPPRRPATSSLASLGNTSSAAEPVLNGLWRTVTWPDTVAPRNEWVPRVEGVPVVQVKMRQAPEGGRPITLVTQQLANGEMISTVEGPATEVAELLSHQSGQSASAELQDMQAAPRTEDRAGGRPAGTSAPRTLAIFGSAPSDSLKAFMLRVK